jgi:hypothetical protein
MTTKWLRSNYLLALATRLPRGPDLPPEAFVTEPGDRPRILVSCPRLGIDHPDPHLTHLASLQRFLQDQAEDTLVYWDFASAPTYGRMDAHAMAEQMDLYRHSVVLVLEAPGHKRYLQRGWCFLEFTLACLGLLDGSSTLHARGVKCREALELEGLRTRYKTARDIEDFEIVSSLCLCLLNQDEWQAAFGNWLARFADKTFTVREDLVTATGIFLTHIQQLLSASRK